MYFRQYCVKGWQAPGVMWVEYSLSCCNKSVLYIQYLALLYLSWLYPTSVLSVSASCLLSSLLTNLGCLLTADVVKNGLSFVVGKMTGRIIHNIRLLSWCLHNCHSWLKYSQAKPVKVHFSCLQNTPLFILEVIMDHFKSPLRHLPPFRLFHYFC